MVEYWLRACCTGLNEQFVYGDVLQDWDCTVLYDNGGYEVFLIERWVHQHFTFCFTCGGRALRWFLFGSKNIPEEVLDVILDRYLAMEYF